MDGATVFLLGNGYAPSHHREGPGRQGSSIPRRRPSSRATTTSPPRPGSDQGPGSPAGAARILRQLLPTGIVSDDQGLISIFPDARTPPPRSGSLRANSRLAARRVQSIPSTRPHDPGQAGRQDEVLRLWIKPGGSGQAAWQPRDDHLDRVERWPACRSRHDPAKNHPAQRAARARCPHRPVDDQAAPGCSCG